MNADLWKYNIIPYVTKNVYYKLLLTNKEINYYCLHGTPTFVHQIKNVNYWTPQICQRFKNIRLSFNYNGKIQPDISHMSNLYNLIYFNNNLYKNLYLENFTNLHHLSTDLMISYTTLCKLINLESIYIYFTELNCEALLKMPHLKSLTYFPLKDKICSKMGEIINRLSLTSLSLMYSNIKNEHLTNLNLNKLMIKNSPFITNDGIKHMNKLKSLTLIGGSITDQILKKLNLNDLTISHCNDITNDGIKNMISLKELNISFSNITNEGLLKLNLEKLSISSCDITIDGFKHMSNLKSLSCENKESDLQYFNLEELSIDLQYLENGEIINNMSNLKYVNIYGSDTPLLDNIINMLSDKGINVNAQIY